MVLDSVQPATSGGCFPPYYYTAKVRKKYETTKYFRHFFHLFLHFSFVIPNFFVSFSLGEDTFVRKNKDLEPLDKGRL
jgi:hypothetical protein